MAIKYQGGGGMGPKVAVLALLAVFAGLVYVFWDRIQDRLAEEDVEPPRKDVPKEAPKRVTKKRVEPKRVVKRPVKPKPVPKRTIGPSASDLARAEELRIQGDEAMRLMEFDLAAQLYGKEAAALKLDPAAAGEANDRRAKAETFGKLLSTVKRNPETGDNLYVFRFHDGRSMEVALVDEAGDSYVVAKRGNIRFEIPKQDVREKKKVPKETHRARALETFLREEMRQTSRSGIAHYLLAERAYRDGLDAKTMEHLEAAYARDGASLPDSLRRHKAGQMFLTAMWCESTGRQSMAEMWCNRLKRLYSDQTDMVADANELLARMKDVKENYKATVTIKYKKVAAKPEAGNSDSAPAQQEQVTGVEVDEVGSSSVRNRDHIRQINRLFKEGMDHYVAGRPGSPNSNQHLQKAVELFDRVIQLCDMALRNDPGNAEIESRQADASRYGYHARKMKTLGVGG
jgi:hypothetical protein